MIVPNKAISYQKSLLSKMPLALSILKDRKTSPSELYHQMYIEFESIRQFVLMLDALFILEKITFDGKELIIC